MAAIQTRHVATPATCLHSCAAAWANTSQTLNTLAYSLSFGGQLDFGVGAAAGDVLIVVVLLFGLVYLRYAYSELRTAAA